MPENTILSRRQQLKYRKIKLLNGKSISYRPYTSGERNDFLTIYENEEITKLEKIEHICKLIKLCVDNPEIVDELPYTSLEYLLMHIHKDSNGNIIRIPHICGSEACPVTYDKDRKINRAHPDIFSNIDLNKSVETEKTKKDPYVIERADHHKNAKELWYFEELSFKKMLEIHRKFQKDEKQISEKNKELEFKKENLNKKLDNLFLTKKRLDKEIEKSKNKSHQDLIKNQEKNDVLIEKCEMEQFKLKKEFDQFKLLEIKYNLDLAKEYCKHALTHVSDENGSTVKITPEIYDTLHFKAKETDKMFEHFSNIKSKLKINIKLTCPFCGHVSNEVVEKFSDIMFF